MIDQNLRISNMSMFKEIMFMNDVSIEENTTFTNYLAQYANQTIIKNTKFIIDQKKVDFFTLFQEAQNIQIDSSTFTVQFNEIANFALITYNSI